MTVAAVACKCGEVVVVLYHSSDVPFPAKQSHGVGGKGGTMSRGSWARSGWLRTSVGQATAACTSIVCHGLLGFLFP